MSERMMANAVRFFLCLILVFSIHSIGSADELSDFFNQQPADTPEEIAKELIRSSYLDFSHSTRLNLNFLDEYSKWQLDSSNCDRCEIKILASNPYLLTNEVHDFLQALGDYKFELMDIYGVHGQEYNLLAHMAVGILGRESQFFKSRRYILKESAPALISLAKNIVAFAKNKAPNNNSRGPTQIKIIPEKIYNYYGFETSALYIPRNAAIATMGFLINALTELRRQVRVKKLNHITRDKIVDYLPYLYFGATKALYNKTATPEKNLYVQQMKRYMTWVQVYEKSQYKCGVN